MWFLSHGACVPRIDPSHAMRAENRPILQFRAIIIASRYTYHPQTILAWGMNDQLLSVRHGAPLRLRVERQLGYKQAKYVMRVELVDSLARIGSGKGGYWEDSAGYQWYAGI